MGKYSPEYITHRNRYDININTIKQSIKNESILESKVTKCSVDNALTLDIGKNIIGIIPFEELEYKIDNSEVKAASAISKLNKHVKYIPLSFEKVDNKYVVQCSRKKVQQECYEEYISKLVPGDIIDAHVIKIMNYGIFCDIGCGIVSLLPTNNISVTHIVNPIVELKGLSDMKVVVNNIHDDGKIELTHKELLGTWEDEVNDLKVGDITSGTVLSVESYGVFVRLSQNLSGLADISSLEVQPGDIVSVKIQSIRKDNMKIKLAIIEKVGTIDDEPMKFIYRVDDSHISDWVYSTSSSKKIIESHF